MPGQMPFIPSLTYAWSDALYPVIASAKRVAIHTPG